MNKMNTTKTLQKELNNLLFSRPSLFKEFLDSRREEGKQCTVLILGYIQSKGSHKVPLRDIKNNLVFRSQRKKFKKDNDWGNMHETTLHRLLKELVDVDILEKSEEVENYKRSKPNKQKKNSFYSISKKAFKRLQYEDPEIRKNRIIAIRYAELDIAKEIIRECDINAEAEIKKRFHKRYGVEVEETGETFDIPLPPMRSEEERQKMKEEAERELKELDEKKV